MRTLFLLLVGAVLLAGCGKHDEPAPVAAAPKPAVPLPSLRKETELPPPTTTTNNRQPQESKVPVLNTKVDLDALTKALVAYCKKTQANPISLDEVVTAGFLPGLPALPPGKKFDIDRDTYKVIVVDVPTDSPKPVASLPSLGKSAEVPSPVAATTSQPQKSRVPILNTKVDLNALTKALVAYCRKTQANPISLDEVVTAGFLPGLPALPPGKKFDIDRDTYKVIIVDIPVASPDPSASLPSLGKPTQVPSPVAATTSQTQESKVPVLNTKVDLDALTKALAAYCRKTQANPVSLDEVVKAGFLPGLPALPPGKKFDIDRDTYKVIIVDAPKPTPEP